MKRLTERKKASDGSSHVYVKSSNYLSVVEKLCDYEEAEEQELLVRLPCKTGDDVYIIPSPTNCGLNILHGREKINRVYHQHVQSVVITGKDWYMTSSEETEFGTGRVLNNIAYGMTWFLSREEAEKKLQEYLEIR